MKVPVPHLILFDGVCHLCTASVRFILLRDPGGHFHFASLQSEVGRQICAHYGLNQENLDTFVYAREGRSPLTRSDAALAVAAKLGWPWRVLTVFHLIPRPLRDAVYQFIAHNRYRWFGKSDTCMVPLPGHLERFLK